MRDTILESWRYFLRQSLDPHTGAPFSEADIQAATAELGRWFTEADAIDLVGLAIQQRGLFLADQALPDTASDQWLSNQHGKLWGKTLLPASSGGGTCTAKASVGTLFVGSTTRPDPVAHKFRIGSITYQVLYTVTTPGTGVAALTVRALETGQSTNAKAGAKALWVSSPPGADPAGITIPADFAGGAERETAAQYAARISAAIRHKEGAGNPPQMRAWAREASSAVEDAWVYSCALEAGSTIVAVTSKLSGSTSPTARIAPQPVIDDCTAYLTPPGSPVVPGPPFVLACACISRPTDMTIRLQLPKKSSSGWADLVPWPACTAASALVTTVTTQTDFLVDIGAGIPAPSTTTPSIMVWDSARMAFEALAVSSVTLSSGTIYRVQLSVAPTATIATGLAISPSSARRGQMASAAVSYIDSLGPGEVVDVSVSPLAHRAFRWPPPDEEWPQRAGNGILSYLRDTLGAASTDENLTAITTSTPTVPSDPSVGPDLITLRHLGIYPL